MCRHRIAQVLPQWLCAGPLLHRRPDKGWPAHGSASRFYELIHTLLETLGNEVDSPLLQIVYERRKVLEWQVLIVR